MVSVERRHYRLPFPFYHIHLSMYLPCLGEANHIFQLSSHVSLNMIKTIPSGA